ncbi:class I adenylate-forming enzyme family protein [Caulobacter sp. S45]|uniref:class I adenylate-forming enzyme family protein n=1 Tax=Caulobacter sp. S45 TaxID=1641861 RepID=UPI00131E831F|nr:class I adenylate-forming enzyme family protein [Caulobacter sp. S45]
MSQATLFSTSPHGAAAPPWPAMSLAQAHALLTAPGATFEMETLEIDGLTVRAWKNGPKSLVEVFYAAHAFGERIFIVHEDERISFDGFARAAMAFAKDLIARGVQPGDRVALAMRNLPEWPVAFYGAALAGAIATPLNAWWSESELIYGLKDSGATAAVFDAQRYVRVRDRLSECADLRQVYLCRQTPETVIGQGVVELERLIGRPQDWAALPAVGEPPRTVQPEDAATLFYTSGTTAEPKGALASHRAATTAILATLLSQARSFLRRGETPPEPDPDAHRCYLVGIPLFHVTGCFSLLNLAMAMGVRLVLMRKFEPEAAMALIEREKATSIGGVPAIPWQLLEHPARAKYDLSSVETVSYGGAPAAPELVRRMTDAWPQSQSGTGWGMTETCATFTHHMGEDYVHRPDSCGPATPVGEMKVVDAEGRTLPPGGIGELWVFGPHVVRGYWNKPAANAKSFQDGWLKTGDLARLDEEGFCYIVDRIKDVIIRGGENIYSVEVEDVLYTHPAVMDAALVPIPHHILGEEPGAVVTLKPGAEADEACLRDHVRAQLASFKVPVRVVIRREPLPRNANGKIMKSELKRLFTAPTSTSDERPR